MTNREISKNLDLDTIKSLENVDSVNRYEKWGLDSRYLTFDEYKDSRVVIECYNINEVLDNINNNVELTALGVRLILYETVKHLINHENFNFTYPISFWYTGRVLLTILPIEGANLIKNNDNNLSEISIIGTDYINNNEVGYHRNKKNNVYTNNKSNIYNWPIRYNQIVGINLSSTEKALNIYANNSYCILF